MAKAGIYDLRIHRDQVLRPVLFRHWKIDGLTGIGDEAERARDSIMDFLSTLDRVASRFEEKRLVAHAH